MDNRFKMSLVASVVVAFILGVAATGWVLYISGLAAAAQPDKQAVIPGALAFFAEPNTPQQPGLGPNTIADLVEKAGPAVVKIDTYTKTRPGRQQDFFNDPFFRQFFGEPQIPPGPQVRRGMGSGFIISADGYILTNQHVIQGADRIEVAVVGREEVYVAELVGSDYDLDLAVLKINANDLPTLTLGDVDKVRVGDWVVAIGNPYGMNHTVTVGVVSYKGRRVTVEDRRFEALLQTDASINPGNSGGPLLNLRGEVIGINNAMNAQAQGIGFAIPSNTVKSVLRDLIEKGKVVRPWMGVFLQEMTPQLAEHFGLSGPAGVLISDVVQGGPAHKAGLRRGDVILEMEGQKMTEPAQLIKAIRGTPIGGKVVLLIHRGNTTRYVTVIIEERAQPR